MTADLPENADVETCMDLVLRQLCDAITHRRDLPDDIRSLLCSAAATLAVALAHARIKKCCSPCMRRM